MLRFLSVATPVTSSGGAVPGGLEASAVALQIPGPGSAPGGPESTS